ncbi:ATP-dependent DNA helicase 2 subunit KU70 [Rhynchospora pubera]|uniref:ATP-dependent DNA helicase 2 subunit KU70 n=1 Tax=Rhynchospora pubera TaxID=906938 RepID=A0AAV8CXC6_9POAL|nr:ATP-dependent DNA helicase 2 subunit KU70 [Rhynchospora pubera]
MDLDPEGIFRDDSDSDEEFSQEKEPTKDLVVYLVDASPKMFSPTTTDGGKDDTHFHAVMNCLVQALKAQIIGRSYDEVAIVFFNTKEKKNLQDQEAVYVFNVEEREPLDKPTARLIKELSSIEDTFLSNIGSRYGITPGSRENSLNNAIWVAQALLRKGSAKTTTKRMVLFTNEDDPFGSVTRATKTDMIRTTVQRAKDVQDLGILIELLPLSRPDEEFNVSIFYADMMGLEGDEIAQFLPLASQRLEDMTDQLRKRIFKKRKVKTLTFQLTNDVCIEVNTYALIRPTVPGTITWLDAMTNIPLRTERSFICNDTGALLEEAPKRFHPYNNEVVKFSVAELSAVKKLPNTANNLRLLGFKPLNCLKDYHNLRPSTFIFPSDEDIFGSTRAFIALHKSMLRLGRFALAFYGTSSNSHLVALVAQEEVTTSSGQVEPPGMYMIYLPYSDDIRSVEEIHTASDGVAPRATEDQIKSASALIKRIDLKDFSVCQFANPALQRHYGALQVFALGEDEMPDIKDETLPDEDGLSRPGVVKAIDEFKTAVYGENYNEEEEEKTAGGAHADAARKRKAIAEKAAEESKSYDWADLADNGKLKELTVVELKYYLTAHNLPLTGKKEVLINRILTHLGK